MYYMSNIVTTIKLQRISKRNNGIQARDQDRDGRVTGCFLTKLETCHLRSSKIDHPGEMLECQVIIGFCVYLLNTRSIQKR